MNHARLDRYPAGQLSLDTGTTGPSDSGSIAPMWPFSGFSAHCPRGSLATQKEDYPPGWGESGRGCRPPNCSCPPGRDRIAGRVPDLDLNLSAAGIAVENGRVALNEFLQSVSNPAVYAAGDAAAKGPPLTPVSGHDGKVIAANLLEGNRHRPDYRGVPSVAFSLPPIAAVGMSEAAARAAGLAFRVNCQNVPDWYTARRIGETVYGYKTLIEEGSGRILGAHLVGPHVDEVINLFALAIRHDLTAEDLRRTIFAYPTGASDIGSML